MNTIAERFSAALGSQLQQNVPLAPFTWMKVGGPAEFLFIASNESDLIRAVRLCRELGAPLTFLGGGSNVFADDAGLAGLVVINHVRELAWLDAQRAIRVSGGYDLDTLVRQVSERGWGDLSFAAGIPGTVGGGLVGGAGAYGKLIYEFVERARVLRADGTVETVPTEALGVGYRESEALARGDIVLALDFLPLEAVTSTDLLQRIADIKADRAKKHPPADLYCAGSFFKNLPPEEPGGWRVPAGKLLDECGAKGLRVGGAAVFERHANIIVNAGTATARDINQLADRMAALVKEKKGIELIREVRYLTNKPLP